MTKIKQIDFSKPAFDHDYLNPDRIEVEDIHPALTGVRLDMWYYELEAHERTYNGS